MKRFLMATVLVLAFTVQQTVWAGLGPSDLHPEAWITSRELELPDIQEREYRRSPLRSQRFVADHYGRRTS